MTIKFVACTVCSVRSVYVNYVFLGPRYSLGLLQPKRQRVEKSHPYIYISVCTQVSQPATQSPRCSKVGPSSDMLIVLLPFFLCKNVF